MLVFENKNWPFCPNKSRFSKIAQISEKLKFSENTKNPENDNLIRRRGYFLINQLIVNEKFLQKTDSFPDMIIISFSYGKEI